jgi:ferrous iron transport protein A
LKKSLTEFKFDRHINYCLCVHSLKGVRAMGNFRENSDRCSARKTAEEERINPSPCTKNAADAVGRQRLTDLRHGGKAVIAALDGDAHFLGRITAMGLTVGCSVEVLRNEKKQPVLIHCRDTMVAIGRGEGQKILLEVGR